VDAANGDLRLQLTSPAIDAGNNAAVPPGVTTDLDGNPRFVDFTGRGNAIVDMGAYESPPNYAPSFTSTPVTTAVQGVLYTYAITTTDPDLPHGDVLTVTAPTTLPAWLTLTDHGNGTATLSGTPTDAHVGSHPLTLRVSDSGGLTATQAFTVTVAAKPVYTVFLPLVARNYVSAPDLIVQNIIATPNNIQVVIANPGNVPVKNEFWVDVYIAPRTAPTRVNQT